MPAPVWVPMIGPILEISTSLTRPGLPHQVRQGFGVRRVIGVGDDGSLPLQILPLGR